MKRVKGFFISADELEQVQRVSRSLIKTTQDLYLSHMKKSFTRVWKPYGNMAFKFDYRVKLYFCYIISRMEALLGHFSGLDSQAGMF